MKIAYSKDEKEMLLEWSKRHLATRSLGILDIEHSTLRRFSILTIFHPLFNFFILFLIIFNSILLAMYDPFYSITHHQGGNTTIPSAGNSLMYHPNYISAVLEPVFLAFFVLEMVLKILGLGFFYEGNYSIKEESDDDDDDGIYEYHYAGNDISKQNKDSGRTQESTTVNGLSQPSISKVSSSINVKYIRKNAATYLSDPWNVIDFVIVIIGIVSISLIKSPNSSSNDNSIEKLTSIRALRTIRPLRLLKQIPRLQVVIDALFASFRQLVHVLLFAFLILGTFSLIGLQLFQGQLHQRCLLNEDNSTVLPEDDLGKRYCSMSPTFGRQCPANSNSTCGFLPYNPNGDITSFDNYAISLLMVFQSITLDGWVDTMYMLGDVSPGFSEVYFVLLLLFGTYFLFNIISAVVAINYAVYCERAEEALKEKTDDEYIREKMRREALRQSSLQKKKLVLESSLNLTPNDRSQMRLMYSYEKFHKREGYKLVSKKEYQFYKSKHQRYYSHWLKVMGPVIRSKINPKKGAQGIKTEERKDEDAEIDGNFFDCVDEEQYKFEKAVSSPTPPTASLQLFGQLSMPKKCVLCRSRGPEKELMPDDYETKPIIRRICMKIADSKIFYYFIMSMIICNAVILATKHFPMEEQFEIFLSTSNIVFICIFAFEMLVRLVALGMTKYWSDSWNIFDGAIVIVSIVEICISSFSSVKSIGGIVTIFRTLRLLRLFRLMKYWKSFRLIIFAMGRTLIAVFPLTLLLVVFLFTFAASGLSLFGGLFTLPREAWDCTESYPQYEIGHCPPRYHYDNFLWAFSTSFQVVMTWGWGPILYAGMSSSLGWASAIYFVLIVIVGNLVVLNLFLGACIDGFMAGASVISDQPEPSKDPLTSPQIENPKTAEVINNEQLQSQPSVKNIEVVIENTKNQLKDVRRFEDHDSFNSKSLFFLSNTSFLRRICARIALSAIFDRFIILTIFVSCVLLAIDTPLIPKQQQEVIDTINLVILGIFTFEALVKIIAFGFVWHKGAYLSDSWNILDFLLVILGYVTISVEKIAAAKSIRALRALRPLRVIRRFEGIRVVVSALSKSVLPSLQVASVVLFLYFMFAVFFVELLGGQLYSCYDAETGLQNLTEALCHAFPQLDYMQSSTCDSNDVYRCENNNGFWSNPKYGAGYYHFDNLGIALHTLYSMSILELWLDGMRKITDSVGVGMNTVRGSQDGYAIFFIFFIIFFRLFLIQLIVAVVINVFQKTQGEIEGSAFLSDAQKEWVMMNKDAVTKGIKWKPKPLDKTSIFYPIRSFCRELVMSSRFDVAILGVVAANSIVLASEHYNASEEYSIFLQISEYIFGTIYIIELLLKMIAFGIGIQSTTGYFRRTRNIFDFIIVLAVIINWIITSEITKQELVSDSSESQAFLQALIAIRALRSLRLLLFIPGTRELTFVSLETLPAMINMLMCIFLLLFIYAVMAVNVFSEARYIPDPPLAFSFLNDHANFDNFGNALLTLFRMMTGDAPNGIMHDLAQFNQFAYPYCFVFTITMQFCLLNLFVAIIISNLQGYLRKNAIELMDPSAVVKKELSGSDYVAMFAKAWAEVKLIYERESQENMKRQKRNKAKALKGSTIESPIRFDNKSLKSIQNENSPITSRKISISEPSPAASPTAITRTSVFTFKQKADKAPNVPDAKNSSLRLPVRYFPKLLERVQQPLGIAGVVTGVSRAELMKLYRRLDVPVTADGFILYHPTLQALIDSHVLYRTVEKWIDGSLSEGENHVKDDVNKNYQLQESNGSDIESVKQSMKIWLGLRIPGIFEHEKLFEDSNNNLAKMIAADSLKNVVRKWRGKTSNLNTNNLNVDVKNLDEKEQL